MLWCLKNIPTKYIRFTIIIYDSMDSLTLYKLDGCPYCQKVIDKLEELDIKYDSISVPEHSERDSVKEVSGQTSVPVISDPNNDIEGMNESSDIVEYLEDEYGNL